MIRRLLRWYYFRRYGVCPIHLTLCRAGGGYAPKWICLPCDRENTMKHDLRVLAYEEARERALSKVQKLESK